MILACCDSCNRFVKSIRRLRRSNEAAALSCFYLVCVICVICGYQTRGGKSLRIICGSKREVCMSEPVVK